MFVEALNAVVTFIAYSAIAIFVLLILFVFFENLTLFLKKIQDRENKRK